MAEATPRVTQPYLEQFTHSTVRLLGKVRQLRGEQATIDAGGEIVVHLNRDSHLQLNHAVEIIGRVQNDLSVKVLTPGLDMGPESNIDFAAVNAVVDATHRFPEIFYDPQ
ncbi:replication factor A protein 3 [Piedraia hortae CBS 480.64]|uniref:Replication factor A protein 3 n=1 Tax=Piedraia hortae CBS 480.64 TaxID=1314780 RepID=A0A6A7C6X4_9PEZI|nr:replication factor A protein 3 [Piedraia hortae CBS 480.64]